MTAYKGASPLISSKVFLEAAAGILAAEAYHAGLIRAELYTKGIQTPALITATERISDARDSLDDPSDKDQGIARAQSKIVPADANGSLRRNRRRRLNIFPDGRPATGRILHVEGTEYPTKHSR